MKKNLFLKILILILLTICSAVSFGKTKVLSIYANPMTTGYKSLENGTLLLSGNNAPTRIKFVAKVNGAAVKHEYVEYSENSNSLYPVKTGFVIKPQKNKVYSFMGTVPEGIPQTRLVITYKGKQKIVEVDWGLETGNNGEGIDHYDVYF